MWKIVDQTYKPTLCCCVLSAAVACVRSSLCCNRTVLVRHPGWTASSALSVSSDLRPAALMAVSFSIDRKSDHVCVLCLSGIDSRYNEGCAELAEYLFYGLYGRSQLNMEHFPEEFPEEMLDGAPFILFCYY